MATGTITIDVSDWQNRDWYQSGANFAREVQQGLTAGKTFDEMFAMTPEEAAHWRDLQEDPDLLAWWDGYVSRWD